ncbi:MAG: gamma-glutamyl-gamma-aminobutyrate hydrolase family protein [Hyphomicrobiales bacterium]|nr:gamma-glutamyl-gamma-aminobutyrate hydrolase family protein [Hyphomicrobiales bacterium]
MADAQPRRPLVGVVSDIRAIDGHSYHLAGEKYMAALAHGAGVLPVILPPISGIRAEEEAGCFYGADEALERIDGLFLPGSASNVEPRRYGGVFDPSDSSQRDPQRDETSLTLIPAAIERGLPLFCVCRGLQELNVALGGTLHQELHAVPETMQHLADSTAPHEVKYAPAHSVRFAENGIFARLAGGATAKVNSVHEQGIDRLAERLIAEGWAADGMIEAASVADATGFAIGVQWHPEWRFAEDALSRALFRAFGEAVCAYAGLRPEAVAPHPRGGRNR